MANLNSKQKASLVADFIETAVADGVALESITTQEKNKNCGVYLKGGTDVKCLAVYEDELGNWVCLVETGEIKQYLFDEVE